MKKELVNWLRHLELDLIEMKRITIKFTIFLVLVKETEEKKFL